MIKVLFICHGNICRSPMAEFMMKDMIARAGREKDFQIESAATSREEIGNDIHRGTRAKLNEAGIPFTKRQARQVTKQDYENFDYLIVMDQENIHGLKRILGDNSCELGKKIFRLLEFAGSSRDIADPWYTGNFDETYDDIKTGLAGLWEQLQQENA